MKVCSVLAPVECAFAPGNCIAWEFCNEDLPMKFCSVLAPVECAFASGNCIGWEFCNEKLLIKFRTSSCRMCICGWKLHRLGIL